MTPVLNATQPIDDARGRKAQGRRDGGVILPPSPKKDVTFLKKVTKKLLLLWALDHAVPMPPGAKVFARFFQKAPLAYNVWVSGACVAPAMRLRSAATLRDR
jgi:hypothetical protein